MEIKQKDKKEENAGNVRGEKEEMGEAMIMENEEKGEEKEKKSEREKENAENVVGGRGRVIKETEKRRRRERQ